MLVELQSINKKEQIYEGYIRMVHSLFCIRINIYIYICGPITTLFFNSKRKFLLFINDYIENVVGLLKKKMQTIAINYPSIQGSYIERQNKY